MKRFLFVLFVLIMISISVPILIAGGRRDTAANDGRLNVVVTAFPAYDFVRQIVGEQGLQDRVNLTMLLSPGAESHSFEPSPRDMITIMNSDVFIYVGESEQWVERILRSMNTDEMTVFAITGPVELLLNEHEHEHGPTCDDPDCFDDHLFCSLFDEHVWTSPQNAILIVRALTELLSAADPSNAYLFRQNAAVYIRELEQLHVAFAELVAGARRHTLVFGDRFPIRYFAEAYGLTWHAAFDGCSTQTDPSPARIASLINVVRDERIPVVFHIELSNERIADVIVEATGARKLLFHTAHNVTRQDFNSGLTYLEIMRRNIDNLRIALN